MDRRWRNSRRRLAKPPTRPLVVGAARDDELQLVAGAQGGDHGRLVALLHAASGALPVHDALHAGVHSIDGDGTARLEEDLVPCRRVLRGGSRRPAGGAAPPVTSTRGSRRRRPRDALADGHHVAFMEQYSLSHHAQRRWQPVRRMKHGLPACVDSPDAVKELVHEQLVRLQAAEGPRQQGERGFVHDRTSMAERSFSATSFERRSVTMSRAKSRDVPIPRLVTMFPSRTTGAVT